MNLELKITGADRLAAKIKTICDRIPEAARQGAETAAEETKKRAVRLARGGALKKCIKAEVVDTETGEVITSRVFNDTSVEFWSSYVEFGTGLYVDNEGIEDAIRLKRAKRIPWYVHVDMVPADFGKFGYPRVGNYWQVDGMKPRPYLKPAGFERRHANAVAVIDEIRKMIEEACA